MLLSTVCVVISVKSRKASPKVDQFCCILKKHFALMLVHNSYLGIPWMVTERRELKTPFSMISILS